MSFKIEKVPMPEGRKSYESNEAFVTTVRDLKVSESFVFDDFGPYQRNAISVLQYAYGRSFIARRSMALSIESFE